MKVPRSQCGGWEGGPPVSQGPKSVLGRSEILLALHCGRAVLSFSQAKWPRTVAESHSSALRFLHAFPWGPATVPSGGGRLPLCRPLGGV